MERATLLLLGMLACAPVEPAPAPSPPPGASRAPAPSVERWRLAGRVDADGPSGVPFEGAAEALARCEATRPCRVERWVSVDAPTEELRILRRGEDLEVPGQGEGWRTRWRSVNGALSPCMGDLLSATPAEDPTGVRGLERQGEDWRWTLDLGGHNRCRLEGRLVLQARRDQADASALTCAGKAWSEGGRDCALAHLRADLRARALLEWAELDLEERAEWLSVLEQDPEAALLIEELRAAPAPIVR